MTIERARALLIFHGALLILAGMLAGIPFTNAITDGWGPEAVRAWRVVHTSLLMGGVLFFALGPAVPYLALGEPALRLLVFLLVATTYVFTAGLVVGATIGERGLEPGSSLASALIFAALAASVLALFVASALMVRGAYSALRQTAGGRETR
jgi:hypothetical protein